MRDDGIVLGVGVNPEIPRTAESVSAAFDMLYQLVGGKPRPDLCDPRPAHAFPPEAWRTLISRLPESISAFGIVADERVRQGVGAFPDAMNALLIPVRVFDNETDATEWLVQFVEAEVGN